MNIRGSIWTILNLAAVTAFCYLLLLSVTKSPNEANFQGITENIKRGDLESSLMKHTISDGFELKLIVDSRCSYFNEEKLKSILLSNAKELGTLLNPSTTIYPSAHQDTFCLCLLNEKLLLSKYGFKNSLPKSEYNHLNSNEDAHAISCNSRKENSISINHFRKSRLEIRTKKIWLETITKSLLSILLIALLLLLESRVKSNIVLFILFTGFNLVPMVNSIPTFYTNSDGTPVATSTRRFYDVAVCKGGTLCYVVTGIQTDYMIYTKYANDGSVTWTQTSTCPTSVGYSIDNGSDNGYVIVGTRAYNCIAGSFYPTILKIDDTGATVWQIDVASAGMTAYGVKALSTGDYAIVGHNSVPNGFLSGVTQAGVSSYEKTPCTSTCYLKDVAEMPNKDIAIVGYKTDVSPHQCLYILVPYSGGANYVKPSWFTGYTFKCYGIAVSPYTGNIVLAGSTNYTSNYANDAVLISFASSGAQLWFHMYGTTAAEEAQRVRVMPCGNFAISGYRLGTTVSSHWIFVVDPSGTVVYDNARDGAYAGEMGLGGIAVASDNGLAVAGYEAAALGSSDNNGVIYAVNPPSPPGYYWYAATTTTIACTATTYQDLYGQTSCKDCPVGTYGTQTNMTACTQCPITTYQSLIKQSSCVDCAAGTYQNLTGTSSCTSCAEGTYSLIKASSCSTCSTDWYPAVTKDKCLYKGIFNTQADFTSNTFSTTCYSSGTIVKPFTTNCRTTYHTLCCQGSTRLSSINCSFGLSLPYGDTMFNTYCSACPFMNQAACPSDGVCWNDASWTSNTASPYPATFTELCLQSIKTYCVPRLQTNEADPECSLFAGYCVNNVSKSEYGTNWNKFRITFKKETQSLPTNCSTIFSVSPASIDLRNLTCTTINATTVDVNIGLLSAPITSYSFIANSITDFCSYSIPSTIVWTITAPTTKFEDLQIIANATTQCQGFTFKSSIAVFSLYLTSFRNPTHGIFRRLSGT